MTLSLTELERLAMLSEEASEVIKNINKIIRHGYSSYNPDGDIEKTNRVLLEEEIGDFLGIMDLMIDMRDVNEDTIEAARNAKLERSQKYMHYQGLDDY